MQRHVGLIGIAALAGLLVTAGHLDGHARAADEGLMCRQAVGREGILLLRKVATIHRTCEDRRLRAPTISCPQAADESRLVSACERTRSRVTGACSEGIPPQFVGECPAPCTASVTNANTLADCIVCVAEAAIGDFTKLVFPNPIEPGGVCGDGQTGTGEECDPPDDAACPGRCGAPGEPDACECQPVQSCRLVTQPPGTCSTSEDCPPAYTCADGQCEAGPCVVRADCPADGQCVHWGSSPDGMCVCRGCGPHDCPLGCRVGSIGGLLIINGCLCDTLDDCPPADDVCYQGVCS